MGKQRDTDLIRIPKDLKLQIKIAKGKDTYGEFLKKFIKQKEMKL